MKQKLQQIETVLDALVQVLLRRGVVTYEEIQQQILNPQPYEGEAEE